MERTACPVQRSEMERNRAEGSRSVHGIPLDERRQGWPARWRSQSHRYQADQARLEWASRFCSGKMPPPLQPVTHSLLFAKLFDSADKVCKTDVYISSLIFTGIGN